MRGEPAAQDKGISAASGQQAKTSRLRKVYLTAAAVLAALVPIILFAGLWVRSELNEIQRELEEFLTSRAATLSHHVDRDVQQEITVLQAVARLPSLDGPDLPEFHAQATRMMSAMPEWAFMALVRPDGTQVINTLRPESDALPALDAETIRRVAETRRPAVYSRLEPADNALYPGPVVLLCVPVIRNETAASVLVAAMKAEHVQNLVRQLEHDQRLLTVVIDERGQILARSRAPERFLGKDANASLQQQAAGRVSGLFSANTLDDQDVVTTFQRSPLTGWLAVVATDRREFDSLSASSTWATILTGLLSLTLAAILAVFIVYNIVERRVSRERLAASRALGELDTRLLATTQQALAEQRKAASEREVLLREIYHRVKNNLQIIQSLLRLGSRDLSEDQREPFENAVRRIGAMARVHTLLYNSPDLGSIDFKDYLDGLISEIADAFGADERGIATRLDVEPMRVSLDTAVPLAFIATELLTNAYKHAFPEDRTGAITVVARRENGHGLLVVDDTGVGIPASTAPRRPLGLTIVSKLVQQIGGNLEQPTPGESRFRVTFPLDGTAPLSAAPVEKTPAPAAA
jgi:two-component sensor histidine kinase